MLRICHRLISTALPALLTLTILPLLPMGCAGTDAAAQREERARERAAHLEQLRAQLAPELARLGARNWIVIADPTFPVLAGEGVIVLPVEADSADTFREVLDQLELQAALVPRIWLSRELSAIPENRAPGIRRYLREMKNLIRGRFHYDIDQRFIDMQLAQAAARYRVLYIKTNTHLPYSSIAIELDSGYWNPDAEAEVRQRLQQLSPTITPSAAPPSASLPTPASEAVPTENRPTGTTSTRAFPADAPSSPANASPGAASVPAS